MTIKGFITNLGKYNEGELLGEWITFPIDQYDLQEVLKHIGCTYYTENENGDVGDPILHLTGYDEYFFTDWETDFVNNFEEYETVEHINEIAEQIEEWDEKKFLAACEFHGINEVLEHSENDYLLLSNVNDDYDLGYYYVYELSYINFRENDILDTYFDFESYGKNIALDLDGCFTEYGWIEYIGR